MLSRKVDCDVCERVAKLKITLKLAFFSFGFWDFRNWGLSSVCLLCLLSLSAAACAGALLAPTQRSVHYLGQVHSHFHRREERKE